MALKRTAAVALSCANDWHSCLSQQHFAAADLGYLDYVGSLREAADSLLGLLSSLGINLRKWKRLNVVADVG